MLRNSHEDYSLLHEQLAKPTTRERYIKDAWEPFLEFGKTYGKGYFHDMKPESCLSKNNESEEILLAFLRFRREKGYSGNSLRTLLSQVSSMILYFYNIIVKSVSQ